MFSSQDVGARVSVRRAVPGGQRTDVIGELVAWEAGVVRVRCADGEIVEIEEASIVAGRTVPPAPPPRRPGVPHADVEEMQRIANAGWPARETSRLGEWLLRAHGGITGRANSVMAVGDPGVPLDAALEQVREWYGERGLPPLLQLPQQSGLNAPLEQRGWRELHVTIVQTAPLSATVELLRRQPERAALRCSVAARPDAAWLSLMHDLDRNDPAAHLEILTGPDVVGFATVRDGEQPVAIGRASIEGAWAGVTSVDVAPGRRREGLGKVVMRALLEWARASGARAAYLQVRAKNEPALALYRQIGFVPHHAYCYRAAE
ncbi:MAG: GNAT family N-acetyltransferase [Chloroflexota bacterium]|nr:GNAT family N-acetyltransferase [Chloroflexota bacterium]